MIWKYFTIVKNQQWYNIAQDIVNYDIFLSELEKYWFLLRNNNKLKYFLTSKGKKNIDLKQSFYVENNEEIKVEDIEEKINKDQILENDDFITNNIFEKDVIFKKSDEATDYIQILKDFSSRKKRKEFLKESKKNCWLENEYYIERLGLDQKYKKRKSNLKKELKINDEELKNLKKKYKRNIRILKRLIKHIDSTFDSPYYNFNSLFTFVRPYINLMVNDKNFCYDFLIKKSYEDKPVLN